MNSFKKSFLFAVIKIAAFLFMLLPMRCQSLDRALPGLDGLSFLSKKRKVVYANLKTVFAQRILRRTAAGDDQGMFLLFYPKRC
jgi:hypothetical protein